MEQHPIQNDVRRLQHQRELGADKSCLLCGETDIPALRKISRTLLPEHHVVGKTNDAKLTITVCLNCHAKLTEGQFRNGVPLAHDASRNRLDIVAAILMGLAAFFQSLAVACTQWAQQLYAEIQMLDTALPQWRQLPATGT